MGFQFLLQWPCSARSPGRRSTACVRTPSHRRIATNDRCRHRGRYASTRAAAQRQFVEDLDRVGGYCDGKELFMRSFHRECEERATRDLTLGELDDLHDV